MLLVREALMKSNFPWQNFGKTLSSAIVFLIRMTGTPFVDRYGYLQKRANWHKCLDFILDWQTKGLEVNVSSVELLEVNSPLIANASPHLKRPQQLRKWHKIG